MTTHNQSNGYTLSENPKFIWGIETYFIFDENGTESGRIERLIYETYQVVLYWTNPSSHTVFRGTLEECQTFASTNNLDEYWENEEVVL